MNARGDQLSDDGIARLEPFWPVISNALRERGRLTISQWVSRTWRAFGYADAYATEELANAEAFFRLLDQMERPGEAFDLTRLQEKVAKLYAAPSVSPNAVDLMTLHKAKGLEWDLVLVPALERTGRNAFGTLLQWLESSPEDASDEEIAAGILAPIAGKGQATQDLNRWMRSIEAARETAERKRLFYVACTRAREELHLFAAPARKNDGTVSAVSGSLLHAAWPAAQEAFAAAAQVIQMPQPQIVERLAADAPSSRFVLRLPQRTCIAPRLPEPEVHAQFDRPEGGFAARAFGNAMHAFLELAAQRIAGGEGFDILLAELPQWQRRVSAVLRGAGLAPAEVVRLAASVLRGLTKTLEDPEGRWVLAAHPQGESESSLASPEKAIRLDRSFMAGARPLDDGADHLWIVDYKTASHGADGLDEFLAGEKTRYAGQLETYACAMAADGTRVGLYYPMIPKLIWWEP
jgi:hypothetical protein